MATRLTESIQDYGSFAEKTIAHGRTELKLPKAEDPHSATKRWKIENRYYRGMALLVRDFSHAWPYFDATTYPGPVSSSLTCSRREIYSDPYGAMDIGYNPPGTNFPTDWTGTNPPKMITEVEIWAWARIDAARVWYGGVVAKKMGGDGGSNSPPHGTKFAVDGTNNPLVAAWGYSGDIPEWIGFTHKDGKKIGPWPGGKYSLARFHAGPYDGHILSSINIPGVSGYYQSADAVAFGFRREVCYQPGEQ